MRYDVAITGCHSLVQCRYSRMTFGALDQHQILTNPQIFDCIPMYIPAVANPTESFVAIWLLLLSLQNVCSRLHLLPNLPHFDLNRLL